MTQLLVIAENEHLLQVWEKILNLTTNMTFETVILKDFSKDCVNFEQLQVVFFTTEGLTEEIKEYLKIFKEHSVPIICTENEIPEDLTYEEMAETGIRATISEHFSILTLLDVISFVLKGGVYYPKISGK